MNIPTEPIGSIPRSPELIAAQQQFAAGTISAGDFAAQQTKALLDTLLQFEATGSPVITDGEQTKPSFVGYPLAGLQNLAGGGVVIPFADGHTRELPVLTGGPFRYATHAASYVEVARQHTKLPVKQAVIAASALSLIYPGAGIADYPREKFLDDLVAGAEADIRGALAAGAHSVQLDFTEGRLSIKLDPSKGVLRSFIGLNNRVLERFSASERARLGVHTCPGGDHDSTHSADIDYADLLPSLFELEVGKFFVQLASEHDRPRVLQVIKQHLRPGQRVFVGVTDPINPRVETVEEVRDRVLEAARYIPIAQLGTCDDCGFSPFGDDTSTSRDTAFAKIAARVVGTRLAAESLA